MLTGYLYVISFARTLSTHLEVEPSWISWLLGPYQHCAPASHLRWCAVQLNLVMVIKLVWESTIQGVSTEHISDYTRMERELRQGWQTMKTISR